MKKYFKIIIILFVLLSLFACAKKEEEEVIDDVVFQEEAEVIEEDESPKPIPVPENMYLSELTGEPISLDLKNQRPIAVMVDNEITAYPHFGISEADIVYEIVNSYHNGYITRMLPILKDWKNIKQMGSIRSTRIAYIRLMAEYNFVLCHDGQSNIALPYFQNIYARDHISGTFSRVNNGKAWEFTEYILPGDLEKNMEALNISEEYGSQYPLEETRFNFVEYGLEVMNDDNLKTNSGIDLPYPHNKSQLKYNEKTKTYDYYCYGDIHKDGEDDEVLSFKNVIIMSIDMRKADEEGHVFFEILEGDKPIYYLSNGHIIEGTWDKSEELAYTKYYDLDGNELLMNTGKTYIAYVPSSFFNDIVLYD